MPVPLQEVASVAHRGKVYVAGGLGVPGRAGLFARSHLEYTPATGRWRELPPLPVAQHHLQAVVIDDKIYDVGGEEGIALIPNGRLWEYEIAADRFVEKQRLGLTRIRGAVGAVVHDGKLYVAGGKGLAAARKQFDVYDPKTDRWTALPDLPNPREHLGAAVVGTKFYAVGGRYVLQPAYIRRTDVFDFTTRRWTSIAPIPRGRGGLAVAAAGTDVYAFGGEGLGPSFAHVDKLDTRTGRWSQEPPMTHARHGVQAAVSDGKVYLPGGGVIAVYGPSAKVQVFTP